MGLGLFGHMGLHQWGQRETKPGGETKAPSLSSLLPQPAPQAPPPGTTPALGSAAMEEGGTNHFLFPCFQTLSLSDLTLNPHRAQALTQENCKNKSENDLPGLKPWAQHWDLLESQCPAALCSSPRCIGIAQGFLLV